MLFILCISPHDVIDTRNTWYIISCVFPSQRHVYGYSALLYFICVSSDSIQDTLRYCILFFVCLSTSSHILGAMSYYFVCFSPQHPGYLALWYFILCVSPHSVPDTLCCCILFVLLPTAPRILGAVVFYLCFSLQRPGYSSVLYFICVSPPQHPGYSALLFFICVSLQQRPGYSLLLYFVCVPAPPP